MYSINTCPGGIYNYVNCLICQNILRSVTCNSEVGRLRRLLVHSPDSGLAELVPLLRPRTGYLRILYIWKPSAEKNMISSVQILLYFWTRQKIKGQLKKIDSEKYNRGFYKPDNEAFLSRKKSLSYNGFSADILSHHDIKIKLACSRLCH